MQLQRISADWPCPVIVAASGPSLDVKVARTCRFARWLNGWRVLAVNDAWRLMPFADALYACDRNWWTLHKGVPSFEGEKWTTHETDPRGQHVNDKSAIADQYGLRCVRGSDGDGFSTDPGVIHYGSNSGYQAINLALLRGATKVVLVGFDMRVVDGKRHFFGDHPAPLSNETTYEQFRGFFERAAKFCTTPIVNATPGSALKGFPLMPLEEALRDEHQERRSV